MKRLLALSIAVVCTIAAAGCDDEGPDCSYINAPCTERGALQCSGDGREVQRCNASPVDGCLLWTTEAECAASEACSTSGGEAACDCADECDAQGDTQCNGMLIETCAPGESGCLEWTAGTDCSPAPCDDTSGTAACGCTDVCTAGEIRCNGDAVETCAVSAAGCLAWTVSTDCATQDPPASCDATSGTAVCVPNCTHECAAVAVSCDYDVVVTCAMGADGCRDASAEDCASLAPPQACWDDGTGAACVVPADGETCATARNLRPPYAIAGDDMFEDYAADFEVTGPRCWSGGPSALDAVFAVSLLAGETISVRETSGHVDWTLSVQATCDPTTTCEETFWSPSGLRYTAEADGVVYVTVDMLAWGADPSYRFEFLLVEEEACDDGLDNNLDNRIDCEDPECFDDGACSTETACNDGLDNDLDSTYDCGDADCSLLPDCNPIQAVWESLEYARFDLLGRAITFTPSATDPNGYTWTQRTVSAFTTAPGSGTSSTILALSNSDFEEVVLEHMTSFEFYGVDYTSIFVSDNGVVSFEEGVPSSWADTWLFRQRPMVAAYWHDMYPVGVGTITVDEFVDRVSVTYDGIPPCCSPEYPPNSIQIVLRDTGAIELAFLAADGSSGLVGLSRGLGTYPMPKMTDFYRLAPEICTDGVDNDGDGRDGCNDTDCWGVAPCTTESDCWDWYDNDNDGLWNCEDPDCSTVPECIPENCTDGIDNNGTGGVDCHDVQCFGDPACAENTDALCGDWNDNDRDGYSDCDDPGCAAIVRCLDEICDDGLDNNDNGLVDCDESFCFGVDPECTTETNCADWSDNDNDGLFDCEDADCVTEQACMPAIGIWEQFEGVSAGDPVDLVDRVVLFTPDAGAPADYTYAVLPDPGAWVVAPGTGTMSTALTLADDSSDQYVLGLMGSVTFYGDDYSSVFVSSNGYVTFGHGNSAYGHCTSGSDCFRYPTVMAVRTDLYPPGGTVTVDEDVDSVAITYESVPACCSTDGPGNDFQIVLFDTGEVYIQIRTLSTANYVSTGIATDGNAAPAQVNFL